ncbi:MAG: hypothetical protein ACRDK0_09955 [Solirubrobacteraceae bacterium]
MSMFIVIMAMLVTALFVAASYAAANGDLPMSGDSKDRKSTYAAAEGGLNFYLYHLNQDNDYWVKCDQVPAPNATEENPVNQKWDGVGADPRRWRNVPGSAAQYTAELLPAAGYTQCIPGDQKSLVDLPTGTFRLRFTGRPSKTSKVRRTVVATFRRDGFLNFLYFTDFEDLDPQAHPTTSARASAETNCGDKYRAARPGSCTEIRFISGDQINGPFHTNDDILTCGTPTFGRDAADRIEVSGPPQGWTPTCSGAPIFKGPFRAGTKKLTMPPTNNDLDKAAVAGGLVYSGKTTIRLNGAANTMTVTTGNPAVTSTVATPANGVVYVRNAGACTSQPPPVADYNEPTACGNLYISGNYAQSMTFGAANDIIVKPPANSSNGDIKRIGDSVLGLIANNFVRVYHRVNRSGSPCSNYNNPPTAPLMTDVTIEAAILSLRHSFMVDNYDCGSPLGTLSVTGAIAQKYRGPVGTGSGGSPNTGYLKNYTYDDRLRYRSPPFFLNPVDAAWSVVRSNEQVPAR